MTINFNILLGEKASDEGFPCSFIIQHKGKKRKFQICRSFPEYFDEIEKNLNRNHPEYDLYFPIIADYKIKARKVLAKRPEDINDVYDSVFGNKKSYDTLKEFVDAYLKQLDQEAENFIKKNEFIKAKKSKGNARVYENAINQFQLVCPDVSLRELDYNKIMKFRKSKLDDGVEKSTIQSYLRALKALYNKAVAVYKLEDNQPFKGTLNGLTTKKGRASKKYVGKGTIKKIEAIKHDYPSLYLYTDLWLLQFYLGGSDLMDVYFLKNDQLRKGRLYFYRNKGNASGNMIDIVVHKKAQAIIDKYRVPGEYMFPWRKDPEGYKTFSRRMYKALTNAQKKHNIELDGAGGKWGSKTARYTFSNIGKLLMIHEDLLRELQGHERDDVDNNYKNLFPQKMRDEALYKIID